MPQDANTLLELALIEQRSVGFPMDLEDVRVFDRSHAFAVQHLLDIKDALAHLLRRGGRDQADYQIHGGVFFEHAGWAALSIAVNRDGARVSSCKRNLGQVEGSRIGNAVMTGGMVQPDWAVRGDSIQICSRDEPAFRERAL